MLITLLQQIAVEELTPLAPWANIGATAIIGSLLVWIITKAFPAMLARHDKVQEQTRDHFERVLRAIDTTRSTTAREGHVAAKQLSDSIMCNSESVRANTEAVKSLTNKVVSIQIDENKNNH